MDSCYDNFMWTVMLICKGLKIKVVVLLTTLSIFPLIYIYSKIIYDAGFLLYIRFLKGMLSRLF